MSMLMGLTWNGYVVLGMGMFNLEWVCLNLNGYVQFGIGIFNFGCVSPTWSG